MNPNSNRHYNWLVWGRLRRYWLQFLAASICTILVVVVNLVEPQIVKFVIDHLVNGSEFPNWAMLFGLWGALFALQHIALFFRISFLRAIECKSANEVRTILFKRLLGFSRVFYDKHDEADLAIAVARDVDDLEPLWGKFPLAALWCAATMAGAAGFALLISTKLTLYLLVAVAVVILLAYWVEQHVLIATAKVRTELGHIASLTKRSLGNIKLIQLYLAEVQLNRQMRIHAGRLETLGLRLGKWHWLNQTVGDALGFTTLVGVLGIGGYMVRSGELSLGSLVSFILYVDMLGMAFVKLRSQMVEVTRGKVAARRLAHILGEPTGGGGENGGGLAMEKITSLAVDDLAFAYGPREPLFENLTHTFRPGVLHLIRGQNGTGKSTLLDILSGYMPPGAGGLLLNSSAVETVGSRAYWAKCSVLLQEDLIYDDTVEFNLRLGNPGAAHDELVQVLAISRLATDSEDATVMLARQAEELSTGQKRRLAIARVVLRQSDVYLIDEPTANLDSQSCNEVVALLRGLSMKSIVIVTTQDEESFDIGCKEYELSARKLIEL